MANKRRTRFFKEFATDSLAFIINESAAKFLGFQNPVGKVVKWEDKPFTIIGVVSDIMQESPFYPVRPTLYHTGSYDNMQNLILRLASNQSASQSLKKIEQVWEKIYAFCALRL
jgi:hypothetical protein